jgi:hypothetical protein
MSSGTESRRAGRASLPRGSLTTLQPAGFKPICNVYADAGQAVARTVRVQVSDGLTNLRLPAGVWWTYGTSVPWVGGGAVACNGALRFRYGSQGVQRTLLCDLASGEYQLPSCEHVYVDAVRYTPGTDAAAIAALGLDADLLVQAEISDSSAADYTPMILSAPSSWPGGAGVDSSAVVAVPPGAYSFDLYPDASTGGANTFELSPPGARRDFANGIIQPSGPLPVVGNTITVQARGAAPVLARLVYFVR